MKKIDETDKPESVQMWDEKTKTFYTYYTGECVYCGNRVDKKTGECPQYKCWIR